jgi:hypothetical protein
MRLEHPSQARERPLGDLLGRLAPRSPVDVAGGSPQLRPPAADLVDMNALPVALIDLPERGVGHHLQTVLGGDGPGRVEGALKVAGVNGSEVGGGERCGRVPSLPPPLAIEGDVGLALGESGLVPIGGSVTHQQDACDRSSSALAGQRLGEAHGRAAEIVLGPEDLQPVELWGVGVGSRESSISDQLDDAPSGQEVVERFFEGPPLGGRKFLEVRDDPGHRAILR